MQSLVMQPHKIQADVFKAAAAFWTSYSRDNLLVFSLLVLPESRGCLV